MKKSSVITLIAAFSLPFLMTACNQQGSAPAAAAEDDSPEGQAIGYRQGLMEAMSWKTVRLRGMASGDQPMDEAVFKKDAHDIAALAGMIAEGFIPNSAKEGSAALPEIWMNFEDFTKKAAELQTGMQGVADAADQNGVEAAKGMVQAAATCGNCHRPYRRRAAE